MVEKRSAGGRDYMNRVRRLFELFNMRDLDKQISKVDGLRMEVPEYFGYASWKTGSGKHRQALFMAPVEGQTINERADFTTGESEAILDDVCAVLAKARRHGVKFRDTTDGNIFLKDSGNEKTYVIIDQV